MKVMERPRIGVILVEKSEVWKGLAVCPVHGYWWLTVCVQVMDQAVGSGEVLK